MATTQLQPFEDDPLTFGVTLNKSDDRLDCAWFNPVVKNEIEGLRKEKRPDRKLVKLIFLADVKGGKRLPKGTVILETEANIIPYVRATDVKNLRVNLDTAIRLPKEVHKEIQNYQLQKEDVVVTIVGVNIGEVAILEEDTEVCNFTENIAKVRTNKGSILARFILHFLNSGFAQRQMKRFSAGSSQYKLSLNSCRNIEVYVPYKTDSYDIETQQEILDRVEKLFEEARQREKKAKEFIGCANSVVVKKLGISLPDEKAGIIFTHKIENKQSTRLDALFNNPVREKLIANLKKYPHRELRELTKPKSKQTVIPSDFYKLVELEQIDEETGRITSLQEVPSLGSIKILLKTNNILVSKLQPEKGKIVIVPKEFDGTTGSSELVPLSLDSTEVSLKYLWAVLRSQYVLKQWEYTLTGSSRMRIGSTELEQTIIPIPDKETQNEIVADIEELIAQSDKLLREAAELFKKAEEFFMSAVIRENFLKPLKGISRMKKGGKKQKKKPRG